MKIKHRITLISTVIFGLVFTIASAITYFSFYTGSKKVIFNELEKSCLLTAFFYLEEDELSSKEHDKIKHRFNESIKDVEVRVYNEKNQISYGDKTPDKAIDTEILEKVRTKRKYNFKSGDHYYSGIFYPDNQGDFVIFLKEDNSFFREQSNRLLIILFVVLTTGLILIFFLSRFLSDIAYRPVNKLIRQVKMLDMDSLDNKLKSPNTNDEVQELVEKFNELLEKLSETFVIQKNFINYVSHEIKTPLTAISGNLEVFAQKDRNPEEYKNMATNVLQNVNSIEVIINNLKIISGLTKKYSTTEEFRIDELMWDVIAKINEVYPNISPDLYLEVPPEKKKLLKVKGSSTQMQMAIYNIMDNAVKYSDCGNIKVHIQEIDNKLKLKISDKGIGIPEDDLKNISKAFYRGANVKQVKGTGIGLSISEIIFKHNNINFSIDSKENIGTTVNLEFP